ncbi:MAG: hypothetical protein R3264_17795, partial [Anaerolineae bacterium]|nr:hypothetical protein [Anaerolineae bacterium]
MVLIGFSWLPEIQSTPWFQAEYVHRHSFRSITFREPLVLFSRRQGVKVQPDTFASDLMQPLNADFNQQITLRGYTVNPSLSGGSPLNLTLFWEAVRPIDINFTVFVQVVDQNNTLIAQKDRQPQEGFYATSYWQPGETVIDLHIVPLGPDVPAGTYDLLVGLYEVDTGHRLQILDDAGEFQSDHIRIAGLEIK